MDFDVDPGQASRGSLRLTASSGMDGLEAGDRAAGGGRCHHGRGGSGCRRRTGGTSFSRCLRSEGVTHCFGNPGTTELPFMDSLAEHPELHYVLGLQENVAVAMADGYAQASGRPSFVNLHTVAGLGGGLGNLTNAMANRTPMVVTAGQQDRRHLLAEPILSGDLTGLAAPTTKWQHEVRHLGELAPVLRRAFLSAATPPTGPVFVSIPMDVLEETGDVEVPPRSHFDRGAVAGGLDELAGLLADAAPDGVAIVVGDEVAGRRRRLRGRRRWPRRSAPGSTACRCTPTSTSPPTIRCGPACWASPPPPCRGRCPATGASSSSGAKAFLVYPWTPPSPLPAGQRAPPPGGRPRPGRPGPPHPLRGRRRHRRQPRRARPAGGRAGRRRRRRRRALDRARGQAEGAAERFAAMAAEGAGATARCRRSRPRTPCCRRCRRAARWSTRRSPPGSTSGCCTAPRRPAPTTSAGGGGLGLGRPGRPRGEAGPARHARPVHRRRRVDHVLRPGAVDRGPREHPGRDRRGQQPPVRDPQDEPGRVGRGRRPGRGTSSPSTSTRPRSTTSGSPAPSASTRCWWRSRPTSPTPPGRPSSRAARRCWKSRSHRPESAPARRSTAPGVRIPHQNRSCPSTMATAASGMASATSAT